MVDDIYRDILNKFPDSLKKTSEDINKSGNDRYMTLSTKDVINVDTLKDNFTKTKGLTEAPLSCDALYMTSQNEFFLIEFKNGIIDAKKNYEIKVKLLESTLMLSEYFSETIGFTRNNFNFILVYNENITHGQKQYEDTGKRQVYSAISKRAHIHMIRFGLHRFKKLYFKDVFTYSKAEFESEFVSKYCV